MRKSNRKRPNLNKETKKELQREIEIYLRERRQRERARERVMETKIAVVVKQKQDWVRFHFCAGESRERGSMCVYVCLELFVVAIVVLRNSRFWSDLL